MKKFRTTLVKQVITKAEKLHDAKVVTYVSQFENPEGYSAAGGQCSCCGGGPRIDSKDDWWLIFRAGLCDGDGVYYSMLCGGPRRADGCLWEIQMENAKRKRTRRDDMADVINLINGDDVDGAQAEMDDLENMG